MSIRSDSDGVVYLYEHVNLDPPSSSYGIVYLYEHVMLKSSTPSYWGKISSRPMNDQVAVEYLYENVT